MQKKCLPAADNKWFSSDRLVAAFFKPPTDKISAEHSDGGEKDNFDKHQRNDAKKVMHNNKQGQRKAKSDAKPLHCDLPSFFERT
ncbi:MAG: hypothetical protein ABF868_01115 [Sporolactobacillus sp.]